MQEKLQRRIANAEIKVLNPPRPGKKCLVLDIDYTIFDLNSTAGTLSISHCYHTDDYSARQCTEYVSHRL